MSTSEKKSARDVGAMVMSYVTAIAAALGAGWWAWSQSWHPLAVLAVADVVGTVVIFGWSVGIHLFPTAMVYAGCLAMWPAVGQADGTLGWLDGVAVIVTAGAQRRFGCG